MSKAIASNYTFNSSANCQFCGHPQNGLCHSPDTCIDYLVQDNAALTAENQHMRDEIVARAVFNKKSAKFLLDKAERLETSNKMLQQDCADYIRQQDELMNRHAKDYEVWNDEKINLRADRDRLEAEGAIMREALERLRKDPKLWKAGGISGCDLYQGLPPAMRIIDGALKFTSAGAPLLAELARLREVERTAKTFVNWQLSTLDYSWCKRQLEIALGKK